MGPDPGTRATSSSHSPSPLVPPAEPRRTSSRTSSKTLTPSQREKARVDAVKDVVTVDDAVAKLISRQYSIPDQEYTNSHLASILFQLTASLPAEGASIVKAIAILVNQIDLDNHAERMALALMDTLVEPLDGFIKMGSDIRSHADRIIDGHESIENCVIEMVSRVDNLHEAFRETQQKAEANTAAVQDMIATLEKHTSITGPQNSAPEPSDPNPNSYASRTRAQIPVIHDQVMARAGERKKQVLFTKAQGMATQGLDNQDPQLLVTKANLALTALRASHDDIPENIQFMSAKTLPKGDILFDMDSPASAEWIRKGSLRTEFMQGFGAMSEIKDREHLCVVENVPVGLNPSPQAILEIETTNGLTPKSIALARWIKPIERRFEGQRTAFMIVTFRSAEDANKAILNNLYILGKRCTTRKLLPEPRRCYKCHAINARHVAASCREITDICDTCGGAHPSRDCQLKDDDPDKHYCVNCKTHGHAARDRLCPTYIQHCNELNARMPENLYKFFPTNNPNTWELLHPYAITPTQPPPSTDKENYEWTQVTS